MNCKFLHILCQDLFKIQCPGDEDGGAAAALEHGLQHLQVHVTQVVQSGVQGSPGVKNSN